MTAAHSRRSHDAPGLGRSAILLLGGLLLGVLVMRWEQRGAGAGSLVAATLVFMVGAAAPLTRTRAALFVMTVLAGFHGFLADFVGDPARYWKEAAVAVLVLRACVRKPPAPLELAVVCFTAAFLISYVLDGSSGSAVLWGAKFIALFALAGWALARLPVTTRDWWGLYEGLMVVVAASAVLAIWQRSIGVQGLLGLGLEYGLSVREAAGQLRAFAGFPYAAPFGYTMAVAIACWFAVFLCRGWRVAGATAWVPILASIGIALSLNRLSLVGLASAVIVVSAIRGNLPAAVGVGVSVAAVVLTLAGTTGAQFLSEGVTFRSQSATARTVNWDERLETLSPLGYGPGSAGAAYDRVQGAPEDRRATTGQGAGVVDNQYVSWVSQYGLIGGTVLIVGWVLLLSRMVLTRGDDVPAVAAQLIAVFALVGGVGVNIWEEFPLNLLLALAVGLAYGLRGRHPTAPPAAAGLDPGAGLARARTG